MPRGKYKRKTRIEIPQATDTEKFAFLAGRITTQLEGYANSEGTSFSELAARMGAFLLNTSGRSVLGNSNSMSPLRYTSPETYSSSREMEMDDSARSHDASQAQVKVKRAYKKRRRHMSAEARRKISRAMKARWAAKKQ